MKKLKIFVFAFLVLSIAFFGYGNKTSAQEDSGWVIENFTSEIVVKKDTSVAVKETIEVDFYDLKKHGIYRNIPVKYKTSYGNNMDINFKYISAEDENGNKINAKIEKEGGNINIRLGDADTLISGKNTYEINYSVERVITTPHDEAELYWNVTGNMWPVTIKNASAIVFAENESVLDSICFTGYFGNSETNCEAKNDKNSAWFTASNILPGQGLTISVMLEKDMYEFPSSWQLFIRFLRDNVIYATPIFVLAILLFVYYRRGRDRKYIDVFNEAMGVDFISPFEKISKQYHFAPPKEMSVGEIGVLVDEKVHNKDITAIAIDLARRGFFNIKEIEKGKIFKSQDFELKLNHKDETELESFEKSVLDMLFGKDRKSSVKLSKLPKKSYKYQKETKDNLYKHMTDLGYFVGNPEKTRNIYFGIGIGLIALSVMVGGPAQAVFGGPGIIISGVISGVIIMIFGTFMPARSAKGRKLLRNAVGLREYVRVGAWRQEKFEEWGHFEEILPFAIAFGLTYKFINAFKDAGVHQPTWYESQNKFNAMSFANSMNNFDSGFSSGVNATRPKGSSSGGSGFGGGGFSGGGFGGGGGGSW